MCVDERHNFIALFIVELSVSFSFRFKRTGHGHELMRRRAPAVNSEPRRVELANALLGWHHLP